MKRVTLSASAFRRLRLRRRAAGRVRLNPPNQPRWTADRVYEKKRDRFVMLPYFVLQDPSYLALSHRARALLVELLMTFTGNNNGRLFITPEQLQRRGWHPRTATRAYRELIGSGLVKRTSAGHPGHCAEFEVKFFDRTPWSCIRRRKKVPSIGGFFY